MSLTPTDDAQLDAEEKELDQLDEQPGADTEGDGTTQDSQPPVKRGRGRPKGSKNKNSPANATPAAPTVPRKRGRPPKEKKDEPEGSAPKRKRGRPPKNPKPEGEGDSSEPPVKRKRGRPPSKKTAESS